MMNWNENALESTSRGMIVSLCNAAPCCFGREKNMHLFLVRMTSETVEIVSNGNKLLGGVKRLNKRQKQKENVYGKTYLFKKEESKTCIANCIACKS